MSKKNSVKGRIFPLFLDSLSLKSKTHHYHIFSLCSIRVTKPDSHEHSSLLSPLSLSLYIARAQLTHQIQMPSETKRPARSTASGGSRRDSSPDSLNFTPESNLSLFSSASVSVDRCSLTSDAHDRDSLVSAPSLVLPHYSLHQL